jgi:hypothetical protein
LDVESALARFSAMIRMRACWARGAEAAIGLGDAATGLMSGI